MHIEKTAITWVIPSLIAVYGFIIVLIGSIAKRFYAEVFNLKHAVLLTLGKILNTLFTLPKNQEKGDSPTTPFP
jgi:hypothetical protein